MDSGLPGVTLGRAGERTAPRSTRGLLEAKQGGPGSSPGQRYYRLFLTARRFELFIIRDNAFRIRMIVAEGGAEDFDGALVERFGFV